MTFDADSLRAEVIRDAELYSGVRIVVPASIDRARHPLRIDINVGDPVTPAPVEVEYPALLDEPFAVIGYPLATVLAEKVVTMIDRGDTTTRDRDFADVYVLTGRHRVVAAELAAAIASTGAHRGSELRPIRQVLVELGRLRQVDWSRFVARSGLADAVPAVLADTIDAVADFADPILTGEVRTVAWRTRMVPVDQPSRRHANDSRLCRTAGPKMASPSSLTTHLVAGLVALAFLIGSTACTDDGAGPKSDRGAAGADAEMPQHRRVIPSAAGAPGTPLGDGIELANGTLLIGDPTATRQERGQGDDQSITTVWKATSLIDGGDPLTIIDDYLAQAGTLGMTDQTKHGCMLDGTVTICSAQAATPSGSEPRRLTVTVLRGWRGDVLSDHVVVQHATGEAPWLETPEGFPPGEAVVPAPPAPDDWPPLATVGESLGSASEMERALVVEEGSRLAGPPHLTLEDATGGIEALLEVTGDPHTVLRSYLDQIGKENVDTYVPGERLRIGDVTQTTAIASVAGGDFYQFTLIERLGRPTWLHIVGGHD